MQNLWRSTLSERKEWQSKELFWKVSYTKQDRNVPGCWCVYSPQVRAFRTRVRNPELPVPRAPASGERRRRWGAQSNLTSRFHQSEQTNSTRRVTRASSRSSNHNNNAVASRTRLNQHASYESLERWLKRRRTENNHIWLDDSRIRT